MRERLQALVAILRDSKKEDFRAEVGRPSAEDYDTFMTLEISKS